MKPPSAKRRDPERAAFVQRWAAYVRDHPDQQWSVQQRVLIDSQLAGANVLTKEQYLARTRKAEQRRDRRLGK